MSTTLSISRRPGLLGRTVFDDLFGNDFFNEFPAYLRQSTQGYPVSDIFHDEEGNTIIEFALAGFSRDDLTVDIQPSAGSITISADMGIDENPENGRRIARRNFRKTYINYEQNLDLTNTTACYENGLLTVTVPQRAESTPLTVEIK
jgi:HSP20 family molecular chaperone IbpA